MRPRTPQFILWRLALSLLIASWLAGDGPAWASSEPAPAAHGEAKAEGGHGETKAEGGHGEAKAEGETAQEEQEPKYKLGKNLRGRFDVKTLHYTYRIAEYRFPINDIQMTIGQKPTAVLLFSVSLEFGAESGMAETERKQEAIREDLQKVMAQFGIKNLLTPEGKLKAKEAMIAQLNRRLQTARVRQLYLTDFRIAI